MPRGSAGVEYTLLSAFDVFSQKSFSYSENPEPLAKRLSQLPGFIWLDSGYPYSSNNHRSQGRFDIFSCFPQAIVSGALSDQGSKDPFVELQTALSHLDEQCQKDSAFKTPHEDLPFMAGALGYFGYECGYQPNYLEPPAARAINIPDYHWGIYHHAIILDHQEKRLTWVYLSTLSIEQQQLTLAALNKANNSGNDTAADFSLTQPKRLVNSEQYHRNIERIHNWIHAGDCYQVNYAHPHQANYKGNPFDAYLALRKAMPSPFSAFVALPEGAILSLSPERFLEIHQQRIVTQPIKGTIARGKTPEEDQTLAQTLSACEKNRAENLMIVDLLRNDLSKRAAPGSVKVNKLFELQSFANVHHLVSHISAQLPCNPKNTAILENIEALKAAFPGGSITGAPKKRSMEIIQALEVQARGVYCGSIGFINHDGDMDTNIAIRTLAFDQDTLCVWGGGGIVADSTAQSEEDESLTKIGALLKALEPFIQ